MKQFFAYCFFVLALLGVAYRQLHPLAAPVVNKEKAVAVLVKDSALAVK